MKIARQDTLPRQDEIFIGGEPDSRYFRRQLLIVEDNYDFSSNNSTDVTNIDNIILVRDIGMVDYVTFRDMLKNY